MSASNTDLNAMDFLNAKNTSDIGNISWILLDDQCWRVDVYKVKWTLDLLP